jgi:hypothetical protein
LYFLELKGISLCRPRNETVGASTAKPVANQLSPEQKSPGVVSQMAPDSSSQSPNPIRTNGKWAWEEGAQREEDYLPEDWCCIDKSAGQMQDSLRSGDSGGKVFPRYVNWGQPNIKSLYQQDYLGHPATTKTKQANVNPWSSFNTNEPMELTTTNRVFK